MGPEAAGTCKAMVIGVATANGHEPREISQTFALGDTQKPYTEWGLWETSDRNLESTGFHRKKIYDLI